jgi:hypothetical protein
MHAADQLGGTRLMVVLVCCATIGLAVRTGVEFAAGRWAIGTAPATSGWTTVGQDVGGPLVTPSAELVPGDVVRIQMDGLQSALANQSGFAQCYAFASPTNRAIVGSLERFSTLVQRPNYRPLLGHRFAHIGTPRLHDRAALVTVTVCDGNSEIVAYLFSLSRQTAGDFPECWMADSVFQIRLHAPRQEEDRSPLARIDWPAKSFVSFTPIDNDDGNA